MLKDYLIAKVSPKAKQENEIFWKDYRITVLTDRLFRIEREKNKKFRDEATGRVWFRDLPAQKYESVCGEDKLTVKTDFVTLIVRENVEDCSVIIAGEEKSVSNAGNLLGTCRTLDVCEGNELIDFVNNKKTEIELGLGVCSKSGVAYFDDSDSFTLLENGETRKSDYDGTDRYVFAHGKDYRQAVKDFYKICGKPPLVPRFALGNWWSRYYMYTDREYLRLFNKFEERNIPLTVATIDTDWHYSKNIDKEKHITEQNKNSEKYCGTGILGWTGFSWNENLFKDYKSFLKQVKNKNVAITLNLHPAEGVRFWENQYADMAKAMGKNPETCEQIKFDFTDDNFINNYFELLVIPYEKDGVNFWWIDWQQGTTSEIEGVDPLWSLNHYHYQEIKNRSKNPLILSRYAGIGSHRYPVGFSGDTIISWKTLEYLPYFTYTASNVGYTWWSHDIGGHMLGVTNAELYVRFIQFGVFSPINRMHSSDFETLTKEPWYYENGTGLIAAEWLRFRHKMIPYLYTLDKKTHEEGVAMIEPLYYEWAEEKEAYEKRAEYLFGGSLLVAPIYKPLEKGGYASAEVWIPQGKWTDIFTGDEYEIKAEHGEVKTLYRRLESIPVLAKDGTIIPLSRDKGNSADNPSSLEAWVYSGNGSFKLYEDGATEDKAGEFYTDFLSETENGVQRVLVSSEGESSVIPERKLRICFKSFTDGQIKVEKEGKEIEFNEILTDCIAAEFDFEPHKKYCVSLAIKEKNSVNRLIERAAEILAKTDGDNVDKYWHAYKKIIESATEEEFIKNVNDSAAPNEAKLRILEVVS